MGNITEKMEYLISTKNAIRSVIESKGVPVLDTDTFRSYANKLDDLPTMYISNILPDNAKEGDYCILKN